MSHHPTTGRRALLRVLGVLALTCAALVAPAIARADTRTAFETLANPTVTPVPTYAQYFGVYNFAISDVRKNGTPDATAPFTAGTKFGHCVELDQDYGSQAVTLRTGSDFSGNVAPNAARIQWLLESSRLNSPGSALQAAAHQSAIWQITNPGPAGLLPDSTGRAAATKLYNDSLTNAANATRGASVDIVGGASPSCAGTSRTVVVTGTPFTSAVLTITSGAATFASTGTTSATVALGATGSATTVINSDVNHPGAVTISAAVTISTMVQSDAGGRQDFVYLVDQHVTKTVTVTFTDCRLAISKTAEPKFNRTYTWTVQKVVTSAQKATVNAGGTATFTYAVTATKSAPVDSGWTVSGAVTIQNPGPATTATVADSVPGTTCTVNGTANSASVTLAAAGTTTVPYTCAYAAQPTYDVAQTNTATVTWQPSGGASITQSTTAQFTFNTAAGGNPTVTGDSATVTDTFNGGAPVTLGTVTSTTTFPTSATFTVPASQTGCVDLPNVATVTSTGTPATATSTVTTCVTTPTPGATPAGTPTPSVTPANVPATAVRLTKSANVAVAKPGGTVRFTIGWKNTGKAAAKNVVICDRLPSGLTFSSAAGATFKAGKACWSRKSVAVGSRLSFVVVAKIDADAGSQSFTNVATATASNAPSRTAHAKVRSLPQKSVKPGGVTG